MKKLTYLIILLFAITSCEQEEMIDTTINQDDELVGVNLFSAMSPLMPTGDSTQDTENLQAAIHDSSLDSGGTLYLGPGTFLVHASLVRQGVYPTGFGYNPVPFNGTIKGVGKGVTIIKSVAGPGGEPFVPFYDELFDSTYPGTFLIFNHDYLGLRDLTFQAESGIADWWQGNIHKKSLTMFVATGSGLYGDGGQMNTDCINVHFVGSLDNNGNPDMNHLFQTWGGGDGSTHNVKSCEFENALGDMLEYNELPNAIINIGGSPSEKVTFINSLNASIYLWTGDCVVNVSNIETNSAPGLYFLTHNQNTLSSINMTHNKINPISDSEYAGIEIWHHFGDLSAAISNNKIHSEDSFLWGPIFGEGLDNAVITKNKITGRGSAAIYLGVYLQLPGSVTMVGNNLQNWDNIGINPWGFTAAPIWLGSYITNSFVIGGNNNVNIFDEPGYDEFWNPLPPDANGNAQTYDENGNIVPKNNIFTGVINMDLNIGQDIRAAMKQKVDQKKAMMNGRIR